MDRPSVGVAARHSPPRVLQPQVRSKAKKRLLVARALRLTAVRVACTGCFGVPA